MAMETEGCMKCRTEVLVTNFHDLKPGDHISMPGRVPTVGLFYSHHAIVANVDDISKDGLKAKLTVVDVDEKGKISIFCRKPFPIKEHGLYDKGCHVLETNSVCLNHIKTLFPTTDECCHCCKTNAGDCIKTENRLHCRNNTVVLRKLVYTKRKFCELETLQRARAADSNVGELRYSFFNQNCEHFVEGCVNGPDEIENALPRSFSLQALNLEQVFSLFLIASPVIVFTLLLSMYIHSAFTDKMVEEHNVLYENSAMYRFLNTYIDLLLYFACPYMSVYILFGIIITRQNTALYDNKYLCRRCLSVVLAKTWSSRLCGLVIVLIIMEIYNSLYRLYNGLDLGYYRMIWTLIGIFNVHRLF